MKRLLALSAAVSLALTVSGCAATVEQNLQGANALLVPGNPNNF